MLFCEETVVVVVVQHLFTQTGTASVDADTSCLVHTNVCAVGCCAHCMLMSCTANKATRRQHCISALVTLTGVLSFSLIFDARSCLTLVSPR